jgi:glycosyltransferase involved in cell wall biosynthesis
MTEPLSVTIVVVNYNNERFLAAAIDSALCQDHPLCEVIVVDDSSTDNSRAVIAR